VQFLTRDPILRPQPHTFVRWSALIRTEKMFPYVLAAMVLIVFLYVVKDRRRGKLPPSPPSLPLVGHLHLMSRLLHRSLHDLHLRYGGDGGLLLLQLGRRRTLVASTAAAAADLFKNHDLAFASRPRGAVGAKVTYGCTNVSFSPYGKHWRRAKKVAVVHLLSLRRVEALAPLRAAEAAALVSGVRRAADEGEAVELRRLLYGYTNAVVTRATTGAAGTTAEQMKRLMAGSEALAGVQADDVLPEAAAKVVRWATGVEKKLDVQVEAWDTFLSEIVAAHTEKRANRAGAAAAAEDIVDVLLRLREDGADGFELTDIHIKAIVKVILCGGENLLLISQAVQC
jgi:hypothetical protein